MNNKDHLGKVYFGNSFLAETNGAIFLSLCLCRLFIRAGYSLKALKGSCRCAPLLSALSKMVWEETEKWTNGGMTRRRWHM
ncbi:MAG TPA: hypothetical protein VK208_14355 [Pyrinomonadaceae bacterium]|nr:hypothetical protein [Pyrinomonadaceae bacterium]